MATRPVIVEGERNVVITAPVNDSLIISGDNNTVEMQLSGSGALLAHAFRWNRPRPRGRRDRPVGPAPFERHVDRDADVATLVGRDGAPRVANVFGSRGVGKTHVVVAALNDSELDLRDGTIYLDGRGRDAADCLHAIFDALYECRVPLRDLRVERHLGDRRATIALEDVALESDDAQRLVLAAPRCRFILTSRERVLYDGTPLALEGLAAEHVVAIAEQELGRALSGRESAAVKAVGAAFGGHPLRLRQTFARAHEQGLSVEALAPRAADAYDERTRLSGPGRDVARTLAVHGDASLGLEHIEALAGPRARSAARALAARHDARSHSPRYSLVGGLEEAFTDAELAAEIDRALEYFAMWTEADARSGRRDRVLAEADALVVLLTRAQHIERHAEVVRLGLAIEWALAWGRRWQAWGRVLELVLESARATGDTLVEAWALHQLGTRQYGLGNTSGAAADLQRALALRERIGDAAGAAATRQNLALVQGRPPLLQRLSHLSVALLSALAALLVIGAVATGASVIDDSPQRPDDPPTGSARLSITVEGSGRVVSRDPPISCTRICADIAVRRDRKLVLYARSSTSVFTGWGGDCDGEAQCTLPMTGDSHVTAKFSRIEDSRQLSVTRTGDGRVVSEPAGIDCPGTCSAPFRRDERVKLTATPQATWSGACKAQTCEVTMDEDASVHAHFKSAPVPAGKGRLEVDVRGGGTVTGPGIHCKPDCTADLRRGRSVTLEAHDGREKFSHWKDACRDANNRTCKVRVGRETSVEAVFGDAPVAGPFTLTVRRGGTGEGTIHSDVRDVACETTECTLDDLEAGAVVTLTAVAVNGSTFVGWSVAECSDTGSCEVKMNSSREVTARFEPPPTLTIKTDKPRWLKVSAAGETRQDCLADPCSLPKDTDATVTTTASTEWKGCDSISKTGSSCYVTMTDDRTVVARFLVPP